MVRLCTRPNGGLGLLGFLPTLTTSTAQVASNGWPFVSAVPSLVDHLVTSLTLDCARSCVMQGALFTKGKVSMVIFVTVVVVVVVVVAVIVVVVVVGDSSSIIKLSFVIIGPDVGPCKLPLIPLGWAKMNYTGQSLLVQSLFKPADEANSPFRTFEIGRFAAHKLFVATFSCYRSFTFSGVPIGIVSICHGSSLCLQSCSNTISN
ncbi:hypothetical protein Tco_1101308 [Tanacetum coccineum]